MPASDSHGPASQLTEMLAAEAALIRAANFPALAGTEMDKIALLRRLGSDHAPGTAADLARLRSQAETNRHLLAAALDGLRAARQRLAQIRGGGPLTVYDAAGRGRVLGSPHPADESRPRRA